MSQTTLKLQKHKPCYEIFIITPNPTVMIKHSFQELLATRRLASVIHPTVLTDQDQLEMHEYRGHEKSGKSTNPDADEMEQFVGIFLMTGLIPFPQYHFYWIQKDLRKRGRGSFDYKVENSENVVLVRWLDNKAVQLASSYTGVEPEDQVKRWSASEKKHILVARPAIVKTYNKTMGGVDLADQLIEYYRIPTCFSKWYMKLFVCFLNLIAVNSWLVYRRHAQQLQLSKQMTLFEFILDVSDALRRSGNTDTKKRRPASSPGEPSRKTGRPANPHPSIDTRYDQIGRWPEFQNQKQRCKNCISSYMKWSCTKCNVRLCLSNNKNCFVDFHKKQKTARS
ncbi:hypothetical protein HPB47_022529 [Ixodes persulcatus]|uniref:Uncharacterized protein n=1 Tax=Ixodes persulcatus TaxID=34615 RepID=A0AC60Q9G1_IXOPE|nr:hypothetical protein HPB47_022529 [Ixodes persulcatus]